MALHLPGGKHVAEGETWWTDERRCCVASCRKRTQDNIVLFSMPKKEKENWCRLLNINCPNSYCPFICSDHFNVERDCFKTKKGKLRLKTTAKLDITMSKVAHSAQQEDPENLFNLPSCSQTTSKVDATTQYEVQTLNKEVLAKPTLSSISVGVRFKMSTNLEKSFPTSQPVEYGSSSASPSVSSVSSNISNLVESATTNTDDKCIDLTGRHFMLKLISNNPKKYIGVPKNFYFLINYLATEYKISALHIIIMLFKIKENDAITRICDQFQISEATVKNILKNTSKILASFFQNFIFLPSRLEIKKNLPPAFKIRYSNVQVIIDCFEVQIEKPSDPLKQAQTWSNYKNCNTIKYLIGCIPNGLVCFISSGYGGRISDKLIVEKSNFINILPENAVIMADRGFKGIEFILAQKNVKILRPPSVSSEIKPTKQEVIESKVIASLRVHIERVIRRIREFKLLKPHAIVNNKHIHLLDEMVVIACGLINLQNELIKSE